MYKLYNAEILLAIPNVGHHTQVMNAWAKSGDRTAGERVSKMMNDLDQRAAKGEHVLEPSVITYNTVIHTWATLGNSKTAESWLGKMIDKYQQGCKNLKPNNRMFSGLVDSYAKSEAFDAGIKAERLLRLQWDLYHSHPELKDLKPNTISYASCIDSWAKSGHPDAPRRATSLVQEQLEIGQKDSNWMPEESAYGSLLNAWAKAGDVNMAAKILGKICTDFNNGSSRVEPNVNMFNVVLDAYAQQGGRNAGRDAEILLQKMWSSRIENVRPNTVSYNSVINAWAKAGAAGNKDAGKNGLRLLRELEEKAEESAELKLTIITFSAYHYYF